jgi:uncharacterized protein
MTRISVAPVMRDLTKDEIEGLLTRNHVGRIAFSFRDSVDIRPIHFVFDDGWLFGRTSDSDKLVTLRHNQWVAFEVDEVEGPMDWTSVVAHGTFYRLQTEGSEHDVRLHERAVRRIRSIAPNTLTDSDPVPFRTEFFGIFIDSATGRASTTKAVT